MNNLTFSEKFKLIKDKTIWAEKNHSNFLLLLDAKEQAPLLAVTFDSEAPQTFIADRPPIPGRKDKWFQCMASETDKKFKFNVFNLTPFTLVFDIEHDETDNSVNVVNVLRPFQSYAVDADASHDKKELILTEAKNESGQTVKSGETLVDKKAASLESRFCVHVCPEKKDDIAKHFVNTQWVVTSFINGITDTYDTLENTLIPDPIPKFRCRAMMSKGFNRGPIPMGSFGSSEHRFVFTSGRRTQSTKKSGHFNEASEEEEEESLSPKRKNEDENKEEGEPEKKVEWAKGVIGKLEHGNQLERTAQSVSLDIDYKSKSQVAILALGVHSGLPVERHSLEELVKMVDEFLLKEMKNVVYKADECVLCLASELDQVNLNTVFVSCGHRCTCNKCVLEKEFKKDKCPVCRATIKHVITV